MKARIDEAKEELKNEMKRKNEEDAGPPEITFKFEVTEVSKLFEAVDAKRHSDRFWAGGLQWSLHVRHNVGKDLCKHLGLSLNCHNNDQSKWSCRADYKLILFNNLSENQNFTGELVHTFENKKCFGFPHFISYDDLVDEKNGYYKDDKIVVGVELKVWPVVRERSNRSKEANSKNLSFGLSK